MGSRRERQARGTERDLFCTGGCCRSCSGPGCYDGKCGTMNTLGTGLCNHLQTSRPWASSSTERCLPGTVALNANTTHTLPPVVTLGVVWESWVLNVCCCDSNTKPNPAGPRPSTPRAHRALSVPGSPGDLLLQSRGVRGVELDAETHGEGRLGCSENSDTVTSPPALPASCPQHPAGEVARRHAGHPHARSAAYPSSASQPTL